MNESTHSQSVPGAASGTRIRVVHVVKGLGPGGAERLIANQLHTRDSGSFDYRVVRLVEAKEHLVAELEELGVEVGCVGSGARWPWLLWRELLRLRPDIIHVHSPLVAGVVRIIARFGGLRAAVITTEHNRWPRHHRFTRALNRVTSRLDDETLAVSDDVRDSMDDATRARARVLRHGILLDRIRRPTTSVADMRNELAVEGVVVGIVANFRPEKGYDTFLSAVGRTVHAELDLRFVVVGQGPGEAEFRRNVTDAGLSDRVVITGYRDDATAVMSAFDIFTLSSRHEGLPVALMEALALGLPIVATEAGGIPEAITDGVEGRLVPVDDPSALADAWLDLAADPALRAEMAQAALETSSLFDAVESTREIESTYRRILGLTA